MVAGDAAQDRTSPAMDDFDIALTHAINGLSGGNPAIDAVMIWVSSLGVPLLVLSVAAQW
jgi:undecaprenyl-diphosphatase